MDYPQSWKCLVTIKYNGDLQSRFVDCFEDERGKFLLLSLDDFQDGQYQGVSELNLRPIEGKIADSGHPDYEFEYRDVIDLDEAEQDE